MVQKTSAVIHRLADNRKEMVGFCRYINNPHVELKSLMEENQLVCRNNLSKEESYLVLHDTSDLNFMNHSGKLRISDKDTIGKRIQKK